MANVVFEVTPSGILAGQFVQNVFHMRGDITPGYNLFQESINLGVNLGDAWMIAYCGCLPANYTNTSLRIRAILPIGGPTAIILPSAYTGGIFVGQRVGDISSAQVSPLITWIGTVNPSNTGRTFLPGVSEDDIDQMMLSATLLTDITAFIEAHSTETATTFGWDRQGTIFTRPITGPPPVPGSDDLIYDGQISPLIGTQRRRLRPV